MKAKITKTSIDGMTADTVAQFLWDNKISGFGLKVRPKDLHLSV